MSLHRVWSSRTRALTSPARRLPCRRRGGARARQPGRRPPNAIDPDVAERVIELAATSYRGLTLSRMTMALAEQHGIDVSRASLHRILRRAAATRRWRAAGRREARLAQGRPAPAQEVAL